MKTKGKIFLAFILNLLFSILELFGGVITGSVAITSDAIHDFCDAITIGLSFILESISTKKPNKKYTYGYLRFSVLGGFITSFILLLGSVLIIYNSILRIISPIPIDYDKMIIFAVIGFIVNLTATFFTHGGKSINQKAINLHMLEDVFGWLIVLIGAVIIKFTNLYIIDSILSIIVAVFILINAIKILIKILNIFLMKTPNNIELSLIIDCLKTIKHVVDVHHLHVWSVDGEINLATLHVVCNQPSSEIKQSIKTILLKYNIQHVTIEFESEMEKCSDISCNIKTHNNCCHHHH